MPPSRASRLVDKSIAAMVSAIEIYNKPNQEYREETFVILALNAWELLVKAFLLSRSGNRMSSLYVYERRQLKNGSKSKKCYVRRNRSGNPITIGLERTISLIESRQYFLFPRPLKANLKGLVEVRDNAVHFMNSHLGFAKVVQELGSATLQNYLSLMKEWFERDLKEFNFYLMPLAFFPSASVASVIDLSGEQEKIIQYLARLHNEQDEGDGHSFSVLLEMNIKLKKTKSPTAVRLAYNNDPSALPLTLSEEDIRERYPWDYGELTAVLRERYQDFKANAKYHEIRLPLKNDQQYVMVRLLDPGNPRSIAKEFYSTNILNIFDKYYER